MHCIFLVLVVRVLVMYKRVFIFQIQTRFWCMPGRDPIPYSCSTGTCMPAVNAICPTQALAMQHVYGHSGNLGNECADHAAALGSLGLISSHPATTLPLDGLVKTSTHLLVVLLVTTSARFLTLVRIRNEAASLPGNRN